MTTFVAGVVFVAFLAPWGTQIVEMHTPDDPATLDRSKVAGKILPNGVKVYLGNSFAADPQANLSWREPQMKAWKAYSTRTEGCPSARPHDANQYFGAEPTSRNWLYRNVRNAEHDEGGWRLPVIVVIHGGGFTIKSSGLAL